MDLHCYVFKFDKGNKTALLDVFPHLSSFRCLNIIVENTNLDSIPPSLLEYDHLNTLYLRNNRISKCGKFRLLPKELDLSFNPLTAVPTESDIGERYDELGSYFGHFQGLGLTRLPENTCFNALDLQHNAITTISNEDHPNPLKLLMLDYNPLKEIESLDCMAINCQYPNYIEEWSCLLSIQNCHLTEIPNAMTTKHFNTLYLDNNPWNELDRQMLAKLGLLSNNPSFNSARLPVKRQMMQIFDEYIRLKGQYIPTITEKIHRNTPLTVLDRIHPELTPNFDALLAECQKYPMATGQQLAKILLRERSISPSHPHYQKLIL